MSKLIFEVTVDNTGKRLDAFISDIINLEVSRSYIQKLCDDQKVTVNGLLQKNKYRVAHGDVITIEVPDPKDFSQLSLPIVYEDDNVLVVNKPAGILTHAKGAPLDEFTVGEFMRSRTSDQPEGNRPGIVHRLDRDTSGILICAKNEQAQSYLQKQFSERKVKKQYIALVNGIPKQLEAILRLPIERNPAKPQTFRIGVNGKPSETEYKVVEQFPNHTSLISLEPLTGRTHQLRVHMAYIDCPIVGDRLYNQTVSDGRMFLHASSLEITIPGGIRKVFTTNLPPEFDSAIDLARHA